MDGNSEKAWLSAIKTMSMVDHSRYGIGNFRPRCLQFLNTPAFFLVFTALAVFIQSMCVNGLVGVSISTLEKRFGWRSTEASLVPVFYDICGLPVLLLVGYYGSRAHKPRWLAAGMLLVGIGSLLFALPHFTTGPYDVTGSTTSLCELSPYDNTTSRCYSGSIESGLWGYLYLFVFAISLMGVGSVPLYILAITYYDDCLPRHTAAMYVGIFYSFATIGPAVAYIGGGYILNVHTDINLGRDHTDLSVDDPRWVGAWWILYIVTGVMAIAVLFPLLCYPADMPGAEEVRKNRIHEVHSSAAKGEVNGDVSLEDAKIGLPDIRDIPQVLKSLFLNAPFIFMALSGVGDASMIAGFAAFGPKYMQNQFSMSAATAGIIFGIIAVPGGAGGSFFGSYIIKRLRLNCSQLLRYHFIMACVCVVLAGAFFVQCGQQKFIGVNILHGNTSTELGVHLTEQCNTACDCGNLAYDPVCGSDQQTYFSPCHAGCIKSSTKDDYANCSCVQGSDTEPLTATSGMCAASDCPLRILFFFLLFLAMFIIYATGMFHMSILLRVVTESQRSLALGVDMLFARILGSIPGPLLFGAVIDHSCLLWERKGCGDSTEEGSCLYHENSSMAWYMMALCIACQLFVAFFGFLALKKYTQASPQTRSNSTVTVETSILSNSLTSGSGSVTSDGHGTANGLSNGADNMAFVAINNAAILKQTAV